MRQTWLAARVTWLAARVTWLAARVTWLAIATIFAAAACGGSPVLALGGGGTAPGGPLSGSIRSSGNGYNMDGTPAAPPARSHGVRKGATRRSGMDLRHTMH